jgi:hypothetical protein
MSKPLGLPSTLRTKLTALTRHIRLLRAVRGLCLLMLAVLVLLGGLFAIDSLLLLPSGVLRGAVIGIGCVASLAVLFGLVVPLCRRHDPEALAALIEQRYPELGERLTTTVELAGGGDAWHGSRALIALLIEDTERRANPLDFTRAFPARATGWLALGTLAALLLAAVPALFWGEAYADFGRRLVEAWAPAEAEVPRAYTFRIEPSSGFAAKGRPLSMLVLVHAPHRDLAPAPTANLVYTDARGEVVRVRMPADPTALPALSAGAVAQAALPFGVVPLAGTSNLLSGVGPKTRAFTYRFDRLSGDLPFHIEAGESRSDACCIAAIEPVELQSESPQVTVAAPPYARPEIHPKQTVPPLTSDLSAFEYGQVQFDFRFTRPAVAARLEVARHHDDRPARPGESWVLPIGLAGDRNHALFTAPSLRPGAYDLRLTLEAEHGITTVYDLRPLTVRADEPPVFTTKPDVAGLKPTEARPGWQVGSDPTGARFSAVRTGVAAADARDVAPNDTLKLKVAVEDTLGVDRIEVEYRVNDKPAQFETVAEGEGRLKAEPPEGEYAFKLAGKVREGDIVLFRLRATDNRKVAKGQFRDADGRAVPRGELTAHVSYYPERLHGKDRWFILRVSHKADPLAKQEILAQRDQVRQKIEAIQKKLNAERGQLNRFRNEARTRPQLGSEQQSALRELRHDNREVRNDLMDLARHTQETPALQPISDTAEQLARKELTESEQALDRARDKKKDANQRDQQLQKADEELTRAQKQLDALRTQNDKLAQARLDQLKMEQLALKQQDLGKRTEEMAAKNPMQDPLARAELDKLRTEQNEVAQELARLTQESELFKDALKAVQAEQAKQLAEEAKQLAQDQRDLNEAARDTAEKAAAEKFGELARKQQELAKKATDLARETALPAKAANKQPLRPDDAQKAADALKQGDVGEAVQKQTQAANELDRLARDLDTALKLARDPREAARQLAALQEELRKRVDDEHKKKDPVPLAERLRKFKPEQEAIERATKALDLPPERRDVKDTQKQATDRMKNALQALQQNNPHWAKNSMQEARQALERLAQQIPSLEQRKQQALAHVGDIKRQQQEVARQAEDRLRQAEKKDLTDPKEKAQLARALADAARRQAQLAERLGKLDVPGEKARQDKAEKAMNLALNDLQDAQAQDVPASQQQARRELDRLEKALRGEQPLEEKARELARKQMELAKEAAKLAADPKATPAQAKAVQDKQQALAQQTQALPAKEEAPLRAAEASKATKQAAEAAKAQPTQPATLQKMADAAKALDKLADQLAGKEADAARAEHLAQEQAKLAAEAAKLAQKEPGKVTGGEAQQQQKQVADEAKQVRGGEEAQGEKKRAMEALAKAQQPGQKPEQMAKARQEAADALRDLADKLAGRTDAAAKAAELARQQRELAKEAEAAAAKDPRPLRPEQEAEQLAELARKAARKQAELARQAERLEAKGAEQAQKEAAQQMAAAQKALDAAKAPAQAKEALAKAAAAADKLAKELAQQQAGKAGTPKGGEHTAAKPGQQAPKQMAQKLAQQQRQLAQATQRAQQQAQGKQGEQAKQALEKALGEIAKKQAQLAQQAAQLDAHKAQTGLQQARQAMNEAQEALHKTNPNEAQHRQQQAAQALEQLARKLPDKAPAPAQTAAKDPAGTPQGLPTKAQAEQAKQLAQAQKDLRDEVQKLAAKEALTRKTQETGENPLGELARKQQDIAKQAGQLAKEVAKEQGEKAPVAQQAQAAAKQAQAAAQKANVGDTPQAQKAGEQLAQDLRKLAQDLNQTPRGNADPKAPDPAQKAAQLAKQQEALNKQMAAQAGKPGAQKAQQTARQGDLQKQAGELAKQLGKLGQETPGPQGKQAAQQAATAGKQAETAMQQAQAQAKQGNPGKAGQAGKQAAQALDQAAQAAAKAAQEMQAGQQPAQQAAGKQTGQAVQEGKEQVGQAQAKLGQGQPQQAQGAMQKAAQALQQAAAKANQQLTQPKDSGPPNQFAKEPGLKGAAPVGLPDLSAFGKELKKYAGRSWGELPGELRTRIMQDLVARYGEDYAGIIQRYFEQIAATNRSKRR